MHQALALVPFLALLLGLTSTLAGAALYWAGSIRKRYASERDFEHIRRNQEIIQQAIVQLDDTVEDLKTEVIRLTANLDRH